MNTPNTKSTLTRFVLVGGWTAIKSAMPGSAFAVIVHLIAITYIDAWHNGIKVFDQNILYVLVFIPIFSLVAISFSILPAFIGGIFLAWLLKQNHLTILQSKFRLGTLIGAFAGI